MQNVTRLAARFSALALLASLAACNSDGAPSATSSEALAPVSAAADSASPMASVNIAPSLSGTPLTAALVGSAYSFTPRAADVNNDALTFSIQNKPTWASFDAKTGQLVGTPDAAGITANIILSVSDGQATTQMAPFSIAVTAAGGAGGSALVSWNVPTVNADGSALIDLAGFHVYFGTDPGQLTRVDVQGASTVTYTAANLPAGTYYFTVAAYNSAGVESAQPTVMSTVIG